VAHHERVRYPVDGELVADPRVTHTLTIDVDGFGNVLASAAIAYGRRHDDPDPLLTEADRATQRAPLVTYTENRFTDPVLAGTGAAPPDDAYRAPLPCETRTWELTGPDLARSRRLGLADVLAAVAVAVPLSYEQAPTGGALEKRLIKHERTRYRADDLTGLLPLRHLEPLALPGQNERCAFTPGLLAQVYGTRVTNAMLAAAGYAHSDDDTAWWIPSGMSYLSPIPADTAVQELAWARQHFFLPQRFADPFGNVATVAYDDDNLLVARTTDRVGNVVSAVNDYRVLQPAEVTDPNRNRRAVQFDELGMVTATAVMGKVGETDPEAMGDTLTDPTTRLEYGLFEWIDHGRPAFVRTLARQRHQAPDTRWQETWAYWDGFGRELQRKALAEPGPLIPGGPTVQRWVGSGWVLYNNKGKPVRRYEPFFSATSAFEASQQGVGATLGYDPVGRVVATLHPDHTWEKVALDPWCQATWDANDTVLVVDPADDPNVGEFFRRLPEELFLPTWHAQRAGGALGAREQAAGSKAAAHADTPAVAQLDTLGRVFLTVADNGGGERHLTRVRLDIQGNTSAVTDARGVVTSFDYDMLGNAVRSASADAGTRRTLANVLGKPMHGWDDRGFARRTVYDAEQRPIELHVDDGTLARLATRTVYGEAQGDAANHRGRVFQVFDGAGIVTTTAYDFKGNPRSTTRTLLEEYRDPADWSANPALVAKSYTTTTTYDALNRPETTTTDDGSIIRHGYNEAGLLETAATNLRGAATPTVFLADVDYNAKGQRELAVYPVTDAGGAASAVRTGYGYDQQTFRLTSLTTTRLADGRRLQGIGYTYDPVGNLTAVVDDAQPTVFYDNQQVTAGGDYTYDALYRLVEATGREHDGSGAVDPPDHLPQHKPHYDSDDWTRRGKTHPNDKSALRRYTEIYAYDGAGNIFDMTHRAAGGSAWTRRYEYAPSSNRLLGTSLPSDPDGTFSARYTYDPHGNAVSMPHLPKMAWDADDRLHITQRQVVTAGVGERTWYVYDVAGQRVRKVTERQNGTIKDERIYLGGYEVYRVYNGVGALDLERQTLHVMDDTRRVALIETTVQENGAAVAAPQPAVRYQLGDHLGSAALELDERGEIISYEEYYPYGSTAYQAGRSAAEVSLKRYHYTGKERDEETGLAYHGARYYAPWIGRWVSCDPAGLADGANLYQYTHDSPIVASDTTGLQTTPQTNLLSEPFVASGRYGWLHSLPGYTREHIIPASWLTYALQAEYGVTATRALAGRLYDSAWTSLLSNIFAGPKTSADLAFAAQLRAALKAGAGIDVTDFYLRAIRNLKAGSQLSAEQLAHARNTAVRELVSYVKGEPFVAKAAKGQPVPRTLASELQPSLPRAPSGSAASGPRVEIIQFPKKPVSNPSPSATTTSLEQLGKRAGLAAQLAEEESLLVRGVELFNKGLFVLGLAVSAGSAAYHWREGKHLRAVMDAAGATGIPFNAIPDAMNFDLAWFNSYASTMALSQGAPIGASSFWQGLVTHPADYEEVSF
jgi:RHS repeat-associated protein